MKVCIQIDSSFDDFLNKVGQMNNASCGKVCRLIIEHQLTFYLNRKVIPSFYPGVFADFKKLDVPVEEPDDEEQVEDRVYSWEKEEEEVHHDDLLPGLDY